MKPIMLRLISIALLAAVCGAATAHAQNARLEIDHLDRLFPKAVETVDVRIDGALLLMASKFLRSDKADEAAVKEIVQALKGVYVKGVEFDKEGEYSESDVEAVRRQLISSRLGAHRRRAQQTRRRKRRGLPDDQQRRRDRRNRRVDRRAEAGHGR